MAKAFGQLGLQALFLCEFGNVVKDKNNNMVTADTVLANRAKTKHVTGQADMYWDKSPDTQTLMQELLHNISLPSVEVYADPPYVNWFINTPVWRYASKI